MRGSWSQDNYVCFRFFSFFFVGKSWRARESLAWFFASFVITFIEFPFMKKSCERRKQTVHSGVLWELSWPISSPTDHGTPVRGTRGKLKGHFIQHTHPSFLLSYTLIPTVYSPNLSNIFLGDHYPTLPGYLAFSLWVIQNQPLTITVYARCDTSRSSLWPHLHQMLFTPFLISLPWPDLLGLGPLSMKTQYPFEIVCCNSQIHSQLDLSLCKDVCFSMFFFFFMGLFYAFLSHLSAASYFWLCVCGRFIAEKGIFFSSNRLYSIDYWMWD